MKLVSWNCKGLRSSVKAKGIKHILKSKKPDIMLIKETKVAGEDVMALPIWKNYVGKAISSRGASGGITTLCNMNNYSIKTVKENKL